MISRRAVLLGSCLVALPAFAATPRVVVLGGSIAEIVAALGAEGQLVGRDTTSTYPASLLALPDVGYVRALSAEGVLSLAPDLILAEEDAGPPPVVEVLKAAGPRFVTLPGATDGPGVLAKITATAEALGLSAEALLAKVQADLDRAAALAAAVTAPQSVLFVLSLQGGSVMAGGAGSSAEGIIALAGGINAATGFTGFKPMTDEAVLAANPGAILVMDREGELSITPEMIAAHPALGQTSAGLAGRVISMDGIFLLGFGPRTGEAAIALNTALYGAKG
ncbi:heme/hemin ABC transporter substrate-binding protein [Stagnihabitans tardus]|uniref:ABC transporter substrate-binding protein n=1 Tax=Stagnihabitans tardus TaxID=2699202 RepID=A0AAE5BUT3_9RHOB|nr:ABC transporter substrate-binding protein [Stagnihabitans tardus]NBZ86463.1 ABC transporter substrate-binding protein [Stagnihabitans tardus]